MISPDLPVMKSSENKLNRDSFAKSLANVILQSTTHEFLILSKETSQTEGSVAEEIINKELQKIISTIQS